MTKYNLLISITIFFFVLSLSGCADRQYLRMVSSDIYGGLDDIKVDAEQSGKEANKRYSQVDQMLRDVISRKVKLPQNQTDLDDTMTSLDIRKEKFQDSTKMNTRIMITADELKKGLGWKEGPRDSLPYLGAIGSGVVLGAAL